MRRNHGRRLGRVFLVLLVALAAAPGDVLVAQEDGGAGCAFPAVLAPENESLRIAYEGLRLGLERARLPRVCLSPLAPAEAPWPQWIQAREREAEAARVAREAVPLVFGLGEQAAQVLGAEIPDLPRALLVERWAIGGQPLRPLPPIRGWSSLVVVQAEAHRLGEALRLLTGKEQPLVQLAPGIEAQPLIPLLQAAGARPFTADGAAETEAGARADLVLMLTLDASGPVSLEAARLAAEKARLPLVSDRRADFGKGAVLVVLPPFEQAGRALADEGRQMYREPTSQPREPRTVAGLEIWVDLEAADRGGIRLPLALLARADRWREGARRRGP